MKSAKASAARHKPLLVILDDNPDFTEDATRALEESFEVMGFSHPDDLEALLEDREPDLLLLDIDLGLGDRDGFAVYEQLRTEGYRFPVVVLTYLRGMEVTSRAAERGLPFLQKDTRLKRAGFRKYALNVLESSALWNEVSFRRRLAGSSRQHRSFPWNPDGIGPHILGQLEPFVTSLQHLVLMGELGTNRRSTAVWLHENTSATRTGPFVEIEVVENAENFERELLGFRSRGKLGETGALAAAAGGTLYLDGLEKLSEAALGVLRRVMEEQRYRAVGGGAAHGLRCRIVASCLPVAREPEYWPERERAFWSVYSLDLPPLRDHVQDLEFHARRLAAESGFGAMQALGRLREGDLSELKSYSFPANSYDLRRLVLRGMSALERDLETEDHTWESLAHLDYWAAHRVFLRNYLAGVQKLVGRSIKAWQDHMKISRTHAYRHRDFLDGVE